MLIRFSFLDVDFRTNFLGFDRTTFTIVGRFPGDREVLCESSLLESDSQTNTVETVAKDREETHIQLNIKKISILKVLLRVGLHRRDTNSIKY